MDNINGNKLTINKVAELCGVSKTTVSRYLNGKYDNMSPETRARIAEMISELNYRPNRSAQRLKSQKTMLIGCVIADAGSPFSAILLKGISKCCEEAGYQVLFADSSEDPAKERRAIHGFIENRVDGLLINTTGGNDDFINELKSTMMIPIVLVDRLIAGADFDSVSSPNYEAAYKVTKLLLEMGYQNIAMMSQERKNITPRVDRYRGYCDAVKEAGLQPSGYEMEKDDSRGCAEYLRQYMADNKGKRVALLCANGVAALSALLAAAAINIKFGYEVGCCTFDDWNWLMLADPRITAIQLGTGDKGYASARLLLQRIEKDESISCEPEHIIIESTTIVRSSTVNRPFDK